MDEGDAAAHHFLVRELAAARPDDAILSEEGLDSRARLSADRVWIIDPLDGTNEFGEPGRPDWAVHVALVRDGRPIAGAVALPAIGPHVRHRPAARPTAAARRAPAPRRDEPQPGARTPASSWPRPWAPTCCGWGRPAPRRWRW